MLDRIETELGQSNLLVREYIAWLKAQDQSALIAHDAQVLRGKQPESAPFLSVICRTQGMRIEELRQALGSLQKQRCRDFQLLLIGHNIDEAAETRIGNCLDELEDWMLESTLFLKVSGGTRSHPLNAAIPFISGRYFSVFDEDDLVYENWVSSFKGLAEEHPDHVFYCFVETQRWCVLEDGQGNRALKEETEEIGLHYCEHPNDLKLLAGNYCPFMGLSFPSALVHDWGFRFNEELQTTEDWEFFMRARNVYPFVSCDEHVALYRFWSMKGGNSSATVSEADWERDHVKVQAMKAAAPLLFGPGFSERACAVLGDASDDGRYVAEHMEMFLDVGYGFHPQFCVKPLPLAGEADAYVFSDLKRFGPVLSLRVDPTQHGPLALKDYSLEIHLGDGVEFVIEPAETKTNGRQVGGQHEFPGDDPRIICTLPSPETLDKVVFRFKRAWGFVEESEEVSSNKQQAKGKPRFFASHLKRS